MDSLDDIWDEPVFLSPQRPRSEDPNAESNETRPTKRRRSSLFLDGDSDDDERVVQPPTANPTARPDIDAMFENLDDNIDDAFEELAPALDLDKLRRQADARNAMKAAAAPSLTPYAIAPSSSPGREDGDKEGWKATGGKKKGKDEGEKKRKPLPKLDDERLLGPNGFPLLIKQMDDFKSRGKGNELSDLNQLLGIYQFWAHKMYPKMQFRDTVQRVEKLCHSRRMHVSLSVWRDEAKGLVNGKKQEESAIDLTSDAEGDGNNNNFGGGDMDKDPADNTRRSTSSSPAPARPPSSTSENSSLGFDDDFDIDAMIREEEEMGANVPSVRAAPTDDDAMWDELMVMDADPDPPLDAPEVPAAPSASSSRRSSGLFIPDPDDDEEMWDIMKEVEAVRSKADAANDGTVAIVHPAAGGEQQPEESNADDWDDMYL